MRYKIEIIADSMAELTTKLRITFAELASPKSIPFVKDIEAKGMESIFFTEYANIHTIPDDKDSADEDEILYEGEMPWGEAVFAREGKLPCKKT